MKQDKNTISRRSFLQKVGIGAVGATASLYGCGSKQQKQIGQLVSDKDAIKKMTYRVHRTNKDRVSLLGYGCMRWPMYAPDSSKPNKQEIDQEMVNKLVDHAIANGVNYFDTSPMYLQGKSETATGIALKRHPRESFFIATKLSNFNTSTQTPEASMKMYHDSFKALQVDYIDYYLLHAIGIGGMQALHDRYLDNGMLDFLLKEREAGRIRNLGFSFHGEVEVFDYLLAQDIKWDFVQIQMNYCDWRHASGWNVNAEYLYGELAKRNIPVVIMEPLLGGRLAKLPEGLTSRLKALQPEQSIASWAFRFGGSYDRVLTVLSGMTYMEHLKDNLMTYSPLVPLDEEELVLLEDVAQTMLGFPLVPCTTCQYCMPCPYGLDIPGVFSHYNKCVNEDHVPASSQSPKYREARQAFLVGYDRSVPRLRQADHCIGCGKCLEHCPQKINIPKEMRKINAYVEKLKQNTL